MSRRYYAAESPSEQHLSFRLFQPFQKFVSERPDTLKKVVAVSGDIEKPNLGMSLENQERTCNEVSIFIHAAATVRFDEPIMKALGTNVQGLSNMLQLAATVTNLEVLSPACLKINGGRV